MSGQNPHDEWQWCAVSASITRDIDDKFQQILGLVHDISLQKQVEEKLRNLNQEVDIRKSTSSATRTSYYNSRRA